MIKASLVARSVVVLAVGFLPANGSAQVTDSFNELPGVLKVGQQIVVMDKTGRATKGKVVDVSGTSLVIERHHLVVPERLAFPESMVTSIKRTDSLANGMWIGLGVGYIPFILWGRTYCNDCPADAALLGMAAFLGPAVLVGALVDGAIGNDLVYVAGSGSRRSSLAVSPWVNRRGLGISASLRF